MKRIGLALATMLLLMTSGMAFGQKNTPYIFNTKHNFGAGPGSGWASSEICKPCHTPHNAIESEVSDRIWAHTLSVASYTMPGGAVLSQTDALDPYSRLCMGCHDGTVALDAFVGSSSASSFLSNGNAAYIGTDLSNDHPVGNEAVYPMGANASSSMKDPVAGRGGNGWAVGTTNTTLGTGSLPLRLADNGSDYVVSCGTCHNPHGAGQNVIAGNGYGTPYPKLLRGLNTNSQLCTTCHIK